MFQKNRARYKLLKRRVFRVQDTVESDGLSQPGLSKNFHRKVPMLAPAEKKSENHKTYFFRGDMWVEAFPSLSFPLL